MNEVSAFGVIHKSLSVHAQRAAKAGRAGARTARWAGKHRKGLILTGTGVTAAAYMNKHREKR